MNQANPTVGPLFKQSYFIKAIQDTVDQQGIINGIYKGWGYPSTGAIPQHPGRQPALPEGRLRAALVFDTAAAKKLLTDHGWNTSSTPAVCASPGTGDNQCGPGVPAGAKAARFSLRLPVRLGPLRTPCPRT